MSAEQEHIQERIRQLQDELERLKVRRTKEPVKYHAAHKRRPEWFRGVIQGGGVAALVIGWMRRHHGPALAAASTAAAAGAALWAVDPGAQSMGPPAYAGPPSVVSQSPKTVRVTVSAPPAARATPLKVAPRASAARTLTVAPSTAAATPTQTPPVLLPSLPLTSLLPSLPVSLLPSLPVTVTSALPSLQGPPLLSRRPCLQWLQITPLERVCVHPPSIGVRRR